MRMASSFLSTLAERIRSERKSRKLSQQELARKAGISFRAYQNFEATGNTSLKRFVTILHVLGRENELSQLIAQATEFQSLEEFEKSKPMGSRRPQ